LATALEQKIFVIDSLSVIEGKFFLLMIRIVQPAAFFLNDKKFAEAAPLPIPFLAKIRLRTPLGRRP